MSVPPHPPQGQYAYPPPPPIHYADWQTDVPRPGVWPWFVGYCVAMALVYLLVVVVGVVFVAGADRIAGPADDPTEFRIMGLVFLAICLPLAAAFGIAPFLPRRPWVWIYDVVLIALGLTSACTPPACVPLLIFWLKPEAKAWFGRTP